MRSVTSRCFSARPEQQLDTETRCTLGKHNGEETDIEKHTRLNVNIRPKSSHMWPDQRSTRPHNALSHGDPLCGRELIGMCEWAAQVLNCSLYIDRAYRWSATQEISYSQ